MVGNLAVGLGGCVSARRGTRPAELAGTVSGAMEREGFTAVAIETVTSLQEVRYGLTNSRSVLGSMNDISYQYLGDVELSGNAG